MHRPNKKSFCRLSVCSAGCQVPALAPGVAARRRYSLSRRLACEMTTMHIAKMLFVVDLINRLNNT